MSSDFKRTDRVAQMIQRRLSEIIQTEVKDPRLPRLVTVSAVSVSKDLAFAKVYITFFGHQGAPEEVLDVLNKASSYLRTVLARSIKLRIIPELKFVFDTSIEQGSHLQSLIDKACGNDESASEDDSIDDTAH
jgi:ribosome-binding factor A